MSKYVLNNLGANLFEQLSQNLVQEVIGKGAKVYGLGKDGAREATFQGKAPYPSEAEMWDGSWIFQAKFHDTDQIGYKEARRGIYQELDGELFKVTQKYKHKCDNYILITNVSLSPAFKTGLKDKIDNEIIPKYKNKIKNIHVWGAEEICSFLDIYPNIRQTYGGLLVSGDIIAKLLGIIECNENDLDEKVKLYCQGAYSYESAASLDDAGDIDDQKIELQKVFIDLDVKPPRLWDFKFEAISDWIKELEREEMDNTVLSFILDDSVRKMVFVGGPGLGKSTLGQYISQLYRARLIGKLKDFEPDKPYLEATIPRIPFRVILRDFATWIEENPKLHNGIFQYLADDFKLNSGKDVSVDEIHTIIKGNPILLIVDGLDEVPEKNLRQKIIDQINVFINQIETVYKSDYRIIASTRPQGYTQDFSPTEYLHLSLQNLSEDQAIDYATRWIEQKEKHPKEKQRILNTLKICLEDEIVKELTNTPLQITILLVIIRAGATPPKQREELYQTYMDTIYRREQKKSSLLISTDQSWIYGLHQYLGYVLQKRTEIDRTDALISISEFFDLVVEYLDYLNPELDEERLTIEAKKIIMIARERLVLIESPQENKIGFTLTVMREFFAACHLVDTAMDSQERNKRFKAIATSTYWRNVALFFAGRVGRSLKGEAASLIDICREIDNEEDSKYIKRGAELALQIVNDRALRIPYNELSAIQYSLSILDLDEDTRNDPEHVINSLKETISTEANASLIKRWLNHKITNVKADLVKKYLKVYYGLFGISDILVSTLKDSAIQGIYEAEPWDFRFFVENRIYEPWVIPIVEQLLGDDDDLLYYLNNDGFILNIIPFFKMDFSEQTKCKFSEILYEMLVFFNPNNETQYINKFKNIILNNENQVVEKEYLLPWAIIFIVESTFENNSRDIKNIDVVKFAYPSYKEKLKQNQNLFKDFIIKYKESNQRLIKFCNHLFNFYLNPIVIDYLYEIFKENYKSYIFRYTLENIFGNILHLSKKELSILAHLFGKYNSNTEVQGDLVELNNILEKVTTPSKSAYLYWIDKQGDQYLEKHLEPEIISETKKWLAIKKINFSAIKANWFSDSKNTDICLLILESIKNWAYKEGVVDLTSLEINFFLRNIDELENENKISVLNDLLQVVEFLIEYPKDISTIHPILWKLVENGKLNERHLKNIRNLLLNINENRLRYSVEQTIEINEKLNSFIHHQDEDVATNSAILLSYWGISQRDYFQSEEAKLDESTSKVFWRLYKESKGKVRKNLFLGIRICKIDDWEQLYLLYNSNELSFEKITGVALGIILRNCKYHSKESKESMYKLIYQILNTHSADSFIFDSALNRLVKETGNKIFIEENLNLPLPKRKKISFIE
ncbi:NACHT domain-containing protein [Bacillus salipaludis]|uniref:NACHT domain-containing protein n=1 Tax=Bacillus salipaludis TaxID=2547811 RepID=A0ABW8R9J2_9BACI